MGVHESISEAETGRKRDIVLGKGQTVFMLNLLHSLRTTRNHTELTIMVIERLLDLTDII